MKYFFALEKNIFLYHHQITCTCGEKILQAICESAPTKEETILFWLGDFEIAPQEKETMIIDFKEWLSTQDFKHILYDGKRC